MKSVWLNQVDGPAARVLPAVDLEKAEEVRLRFAASTVLPGWKERIAREHAEVNDPVSGTVCHAEWLHATPWQPGDKEEQRHIKIHERIRAQHQTIPAYDRATWDAIDFEGYAHLQVYLPWAHCMGGPFSVCGPSRLTHRPTVH